MTLDEILTAYDEDAKIDYSELGMEARKIPILHAKFLRWLVNEKLALKKHEGVYNKLYLDKKRFYTEGASSLEEYNAKKEMWKYIPDRQKTFLKTDVDQYLLVDLDIEEAKIRKDMVQVKIDALDAILKSIMNRGYLITNMINWQQWQGGGK